MSHVQPGFRCVVALIAVLLSGASHAQSADSGCGRVVERAGQGGAGPWDYRSNRDKWAIVEGFHFTPQVEALVRGQSSSIGQDLAYTLNVFPNHHRALLAAMRLAEREKSHKPAGMRYSIDCYFERALGYVRDDNVTRLLYATHLNKSNRRKEALTQIDLSVATAGDNGFTHFNAGLLYLDSGEFEKALRQAHRANELGMTNPALRDRLQATGKWQEAPLTTADKNARPADTAASTAQSASPP